MTAKGTRLAVKPGMKSWSTVFALALAAVSAGGAGRPVSAPKAESVRCGIDMRNVLLHVAEGVTLRVRTLDGELVAHKPGAPPMFDEPASYTMRLKLAEVAMDAPSLNALMSRVFTGSSPVRDLKITIEEGQIKQTGKLHKGVTVPFTMKTNVSTTPDGRLRLHATSLKAVGIPVKGMLDLFGVDLDNLMKAPGARGLCRMGDGQPSGLHLQPAAERRVEAVGKAVEPLFDAVDAVRIAIVGDQRGDGGEQADRGG